MGFNLASAIGGGLQGLLTTGNPYAGVAMGAISGFAGGAGSSAVGQIGNGLTNAINMGDEAFQTMMYAEQVRHQEQLALQSNAFDEMMDERSENMRQINTLRDVEMAQRKADNQITKKFIESINE
jgi:hypothetical protein